MRKKFTGIRIPPPEGGGGCIAVIAGGSYLAFAMIGATFSHAFGISPETGAEIGVGLAVPFSIGILGLAKKYSL